MSQKVWTKDDVLARLDQAKSQPRLPQQSQSSSIFQSVESEAAATKPAGDSTTPSSVEWAYRAAAAVLAYFSPANLRPIENFAPDDVAAVATLLDDSTMLYRAGNGGANHAQHWQLRDRPRRRALQRLGSKDALLGALSANDPRPMDALQEIFEGYLQSSPPPLAEQNLEQLTATQRVIGWLHGIVEPLPAAEDVREMRAWAELLAPFRHLVGDHFRGRQSELETLHAFVVRPNGLNLNGPQKPTSSSPARQFDSEKESELESNILLIHGPGGMGKSTLLSKFLLDTIGKNYPPKVPFVYIDFDRPGILPEEPLTLLSEAVRQFGIQFPALRQEADALRDMWRDLLALPSELPHLEFTKGGSRVGPTRNIGSSYEQRSVAQTIQDRASYLDPFMDFWRLMQEQLHNTNSDDVRLVLVLDTFEEVQYLSQDFVEELLTFTYDLVDQIPALRVIVSGRAPVEDRPATGVRAFSQPFTQRPMQELILGELDSEAALGFLKAHGIDDEQLAEQTVTQIGGNPLSLHLAVNLLVRGEDEGASGDTPDLVDTRTVALQLDQGLIQGQLYTRILNHIHNEDVRKLAHPGLVLRRVTPELIKDVLAETCHVDVPTMDRARELFNAMMNEVALLRTASDGSLHHRPDVRRIMLKSLQRDEPLRVFEIHKQAVEFYAALDGPINRAEEIYHLLLSGADNGTIDARWIEGIEPFLRNVIEELPPDKQPYLASRLGVTSAEFDWDQADIEEWERYTESRVIDLVSLGRPDHALELLAERSERTIESPLYRLEAQILAGQERWLEAQQVAKAGIFAASQAEDDEKLLDLLRVAANANEHLGEYAQALEMLDAAEALEVELREPEASLLRLELVTQRLRLVRIGGETSQSGTAEQKESAYSIYQEVGQSRGFQMNGRLPLLRDLAVEIGMEHIDVLQVAASFVDETQFSPSHLALLDKMSQGQETAIKENWRAIQANLPTMPLMSSTTRL